MRISRNLDTFFFQSYLSSSLLEGFCECFECFVLSTSHPCAFCSLNVSDIQISYICSSGVVAGGSCPPLNMGAIRDKGVPKLFACNIWLGTSKLIVHGLVFGSPSSSTNKISSPS